MKFIQYFLLIMLVLVSSSLLAEPGLTQQSVTRMLKGMDKAIEMHDAESLMSHFSDKAIITFAMGEEDGSKEFSMLEYKKMVEQGWSMQGDQHYEVKDVMINIAADRRNAIVTDLVIETVIVEGIIITSTKTREKMTVKLHDNKPVITGLYGKVEL